MQSYDSDFRGRLYCRGCPSVERYIFYCPGLAPAHHAHTHLQALLAGETAQFGAQAAADDYLTSIKAANVSMEEEQKAAEKEQMLNGADE